MKMRSILGSGRPDGDSSDQGNGLEDVWADGEQFIPEDEALALGIIAGTRQLLRSEKILREAPSLTEKQKQTVSSDIQHSKAFIHKRWVKMEDPTYVVTYFNQERAGGKSYQDVDLPRWIEALTWSPERMKELETESSEG